MADNGEAAAKCPVMHGPLARGTTSNEHWWPNQLSLKMLDQNSPKSNPPGATVDNILAASADNEIPSIGPGQCVIVVAADP